MKKLVNRLSQRMSHALTLLFLVIFTVTIVFLLYRNNLLQNMLLHMQQVNATLLSQKNNAQQQYTTLKNTDQVKRNDLLFATEKNMQSTYADSITAYQDMLDLRSQNQKTDTLEALYAQVVQELSQSNYISASANLTQLKTQIQQTKDAFAASSPGGVSAPVNATTSNTPPKNGFNQQYVTTTNGTFFVDIIAADLNTTKVIVDTASNSDCSNNCPVLSLSDYVSRNGALAGINGSFFCPADYPSCSGKTGSFDTLLMNKNKVYFNSSNNVYSTVPAVAIYGNTIRFMAHSSDWGRDSSVDAVIAMQPLLILDSQIVYNGSSDEKFTSKGSRGFIANIASTVYIGDVLGATMQDSAAVLHALGMNNALNLDEGGSTALWYGGYKLGPGRNIPNAVLFTHK